MSLEQQIRRAIENGLKYKEKEFIIFPFGDVGVQAKRCLNVCYGIEEAYIIDNNLCKYNPKIKDISFLDVLNPDDYVVLLASTNFNIYAELMNSLVAHFPAESVVELPMMLEQKEKKYSTAIGKYSYGPLCKDHRFIRSIGAFCGFGKGSRVVLNHPMEYITLHPMVYLGKAHEEFECEYTKCKRGPWYFPGVQPHDIKKVNRRITIGNDVWFGENVIVTNGANIGNGVIAGAGAVITKDVPDYAVVVGVPARIIRYRYTPEQIEKLNKIAWWDWPDEVIRERYDDFYLDIEAFLEKYYQ